MLIETGLSKNGLYYAKEVLKRAAPIFEGVKACYYEWKKHFDHLPEIIEKIRPEGFPHQIFGSFDNVKYETVEIEGKKKEGLTAFLHIHDGAKWLKEMLTDAWERGKRNLLGLSINAEGPHQIEFINGRPLDVVKDIKDAFSVDLVTSPAAGGQFARLMASIKKGREENMDWLLKIVGILKESKPELLEGLDEQKITEEEVVNIFTKLLAKKEAEEDGDADEQKMLSTVITLLKEKKYTEALEQLKQWVGKGTEKTDEEKEAEAKAKTEADAKTEKEAREKKEKEAKEKAEKETREKKEKEGEDLTKKVSDLIEKGKIAECEKILDALLTSSKLPEAVQEKVRKSFSGKTFKEADLKDSIKSEKDMLVKLSESGDIVDLGDGNNLEVKVGSNRVDGIQKNLDLTIDPDIKGDEKLKESYEGFQPFRSIREWYVKATGDTEISGQISRTKLREAVSSDIPQIIQDAMNKRMAREYSLLPPKYKQLCDIVPGGLKDFKTQHVIRLGGFAQLEIRDTTVSPGTGETVDTDYPTIAFPADEEATYDADTRGGLVNITRRMIINDDLRTMQKIPGKIAKAAMRALNSFVFDLFLNWGSDAINGGTIYDDLALYHANHGNLAATAFDYDPFVAARERLKQQREFGYEADLASDPLAEAAGTFDVDSTAIGANFKVGDYVQIEAEILGPITDVTTGTITAARGAWGTTDAEHAADSAVKVITDDLELEVGTIWVPNELETEALMIKNSEYVPGRTTRERNPYQNKFEVEVLTRRESRGDVNNWFMTAKKGQIEMIELGFLGSKETPELFMQDAPGVGLVFTRDVIRYKVRHEYGGTVVDYRGFQSNIVA